MMFYGMETTNVIPICWVHDQRYATPTTKKLTKHITDTYIIWCTHADEQDNCELAFLLKYWLNTIGMPFQTGCRN